MRLIVDENKCVGCQMCVQICASLSESKEGYTANKVFNPAKSKIRIETEPLQDPKAYVCKQCEEPKCVDACPTGALKLEDGYVKFIREECIHCFSCVDACPWGLIFRHEDLDIPLKCDLCGGEPKCIEHCPRDAIRVGD
jgi:Fe-S-cluster-containing dehydrogenase component